MLTLIQGATVYAPTFLGTQDVLIGGGKIIAIDENITLDSSVLVKRIAGKNKLVAPGFVDSLVHITGGGGEAASVPELTIRTFSIDGTSSFTFSAIKISASVGAP